MPRTISASVGDGGANRNSDIRTIQEMLNRVPPSWGGPAPALAVDGLIGPKTIGAIRNFQQIQLGTIFNPDGRVDPGRRTIGRLNHIWDSAERPGGSFHLSRERSEEHTSELPSIMRISYAVFCVKKTQQTSAETTTRPTSRKD